MNPQRCVLFAYNVLLLFYPPSFRRRFATEMLEIAEAAEPAEWPLIFGDTSLAIVRSWLEPGVPHSAAVTAGPDAYLAIGESGLPTLRILRASTERAGETFAVREARRTCSRCSKSRAKA